MNSADPNAASGAKEPAQESPAKVARNGYGVKWDWMLGLGSLLILILAFVFDLDPDANVASAGQTLPSICWFRNMTGLDCPGCGLTRGFVALAEGQLVAAWNFNPASLLWFAVIAAQIPWRAYRLGRHYFGRERDADARGSSQPTNRLAALVMIVLGLALIVQWIARISSRL